MSSRNGAISLLLVFLYLFKGLKLQLLQCTCWFYLVLLSKTFLCVFLISLRGISAHLPGAVQMFSIVNTDTLSSRSICRSEKVSGMLRFHVTMAQTLSRWLIGMEYIKPHQFFLGFLLTENHPHDYTSHLDLTGSHTPKIGELFNVFVSSKSRSFILSAVWKWRSKAAQSIIDLWWHLDTISIFHIQMVWSVKNTMYNIRLE